MWQSVKHPEAKCLTLCFCLFQGGFINLFVGKLDELKIEFGNRNE
jgi:hypothetical protein